MSNVLQHTNPNGTVVEIQLCEGTKPDKVTIGKNVTIGQNLKITVDAVVNENVIIGDNVTLIHCNLGRGVHVEENAVIRHYNSKSTSIGVNTWVKAVAYIHADVGKNSIIGAAAIIHRALPAGSIIGNKSKVYGTAPSWYNDDKPVVVNIGDESEATFNDKDSNLLSLIVEDNVSFNGDVKGTVYVGRASSLNVERACDVTVPPRTKIYSLGLNLNAQVLICNVAGRTVWHAPGNRLEIEGEAFPPETQALLAALSHSMLARDARL